MRRNTMECLHDRNLRASKPNKRIINKLSTSQLRTMPARPPLFKVACHAGSSIENT